MNKEIKRAKPPYVQSSINKEVELNENSSSEYKQVVIERVINHHQGNNNEKQHAEAAVHQHFEESLKLAQQQRVSV